jgi:hypothetical protein
MAFDDHALKGIKVRNTRASNFNDNDIGSAKYGIDIRDDGSNLSTESLIVDGNSIDNAQHAIYLKNVRDTEVDNNTLTAFDHGIEYYADQNYQNATVIRKNKVTGGTASQPSGHGIVVSPEEDPVNAGSGANTSGNTINLDIECNKIWYNELGIVGSGELIDQGTFTDPAGNNFDDQTGNSQNSEWDILWQYPVSSGGGGTGFEYFYFKGPNSGYKPNSSLIPFPKSMNGFNNHSTADFKTTQTGFQGCYATWKRNPNTALKIEESSSENAVLKVYPNPFESQLRLKGKGSTKTTVRVSTVLGQQVYQDRFSGKAKTIATDKWKAGMYVIEVVSQHGEVLQTQKVLKVD